MSNTINPRPINPILQQFEKIGIPPRSPAWYLIQDLTTRSDKVLTNKGEIQAQANITGRTDPIQTTVKNLDPSGNFSSLGNVNNTLTDFLTDGAGSPLTGGKRGFQALDTNNRLANSFRATGVNVSSTPTSGTTLSNDGTHTFITINASTNQFAPGTVNYNSGSFDPGSFGGPNYLFFNDPAYAGGPVTYQQSATPQQETAAEGNVIAGSITTVNGASKTGGGNTGGSGGSRGGRGFIQ